MSRIKRIHLENFLSIKDPVTLDFSPITLLYGQNSVGKSTIFDALDVLNKLSKNVTGNFELRGKSAAQCTHMHDPNCTMVIGLGHTANIHSGSLDLRDTLGFDNFFPNLSAFLMKDIEGYDAIEGRDIDIDIYWIYSNLGKNHSIKVHVDGEWFYTFSPEDDASFTFNLHSKWLKKLNKYIGMDTGRSFSDLFLMMGTYEEVIVDEEKEILLVDLDLSVSKVSEGDFVTNHISNRLYIAPFGELQSELEITEKIIPLLRCFILIPFGSLWDDNIHIGPFREYSKKDSSDWYNGTAAWEYLRDFDNPKSKQLISNVNDWLSSSDRLALPYEVSRSVRLVEYKELEDIHDQAEQLTHEVNLKLKLFSKEKKPIYLDFSGVGAGIIQVIPILVAGLLHRRIHIEQPELHLHPKMQADLTDFFIGLVKGDASFVESSSSPYDHVSIIETHSEYIALRLLRRIRETTHSDIMPKRLKLTKEDVTFYYFDSDGKTTNIKKLGVTDDGEFSDRWPQGFFPEREKELFDDDF